MIGPSCGGFMNKLDHLIQQILEYFLAFRTINNHETYALLFFNKFNGYASLLLFSFDKFVSLLLNIFQLKFELSSINMNILCHYRRTQYP